MNRKIRLTKVGIAVSKLQNLLDNKVIQLNEYTYNYEMLCTDGCLINIVNRKTKEFNSFYVDKTTSNDIINQSVTNIINNFKKDTK